MHAVQLLLLLTLLTPSSPEAGPGPCAAVKAPPVDAVAAAAVNSTKLPLASAAVAGEAPALTPVLMPGRIIARELEVYPGEYPAAGKLTEISFWVLMPDGADALKDLSGIELSLCRGSTTLETTASTLEAFAARENALIAQVAQARGTPLPSARHHLVVPSAFAVDGIVYRFLWRTPAGASRSFRLPVESYVTKTSLRLPFAGSGVVFAGHELADHHTAAPNQWFAYDLAPTDATGAWLRDTKGENASYAGWGQPILAPAAGVVVDARGDIPDNARPLVVPDVADLLVHGEKNRVAGGNFVLLDHGNGEHSYLAHMQKGSVRVAKGDRVEQGDVLGQLGNSGISGAPHLHFQLQACAEPLACVSLPAPFTDLEAAHVEGVHTYAPARGVLVTSKAPPSTPARDAQNP